MVVLGGWVAYMIAAHITPKVRVLVVVGGWMELGGWVGGPGCGGGGTENSNRLPPMKAVPAAAAVLSGLFRCRASMLCLLCGAGHPAVEAPGRDVQRAWPGAAGHLLPHPGAGPDQVSLPLPEQGEFPSRLLFAKLARSQHDICTWRGACAIPSSPPSKPRSAFCSLQVLKRDKEDLDARYDRALLYAELDDDKKVGQGTCSEAGMVVFDCDCVWLGVCWGRGGLLSQAGWLLGTWQVERAQLRLTLYLGLRSHAVLCLARLFAW